LRGGTGFPGRSAAPSVAAGQPDATIAPAHRKRRGSMKKALSLAAVLVIVAVSLLGFTRNAQADEIKMVGVITKIEIAGKDSKTATATLKDNKTEAQVVITVNDDLTLDKFKDHRIVEGDEIRCKYEVIDGKNVSKLFRKTAGC
jgi:hypothetical protein